MTQGEDRVSGLPFIITGPPEPGPNPEPDHVRVWYVPIISDPTAPTVAEMQAGVALEMTCRAPWYLRRGFTPPGLGPVRRTAWRARARLDRWGLSRAMRRG